MSELIEHFAASSCNNKMGVTQKMGVDKPDKMKKQ
jgi:hypothetical protein